jgi:hypothetical protein
MLKTFISGIVTLVGLFGSKPSFLKVMSAVMSVLPSLIQNVIDFKAANAEQKVDEFLTALDEYTGTDEGAVKIFPHMERQAEEAFWDSIGGAARVYCYVQLKKPGYYLP